MSFISRLYLPFDNLIRKRWHMVVALICGSGGGWLATQLGLPLGWMIGAMLAVGTLSWVGVNVRIPGVLRWLVLAVIGTYLGASFTSDFIDWLPRSIVTVVVMCITVTVEVALATWLLRRVLHCNFITAYTACMPGGFSTMLIIAREHGGDEEIVSLVQLVRMVCVIVTITMLAWYLGIDGGGVRPTDQPEFSTADLLLACSFMLVGLGIAILLRLPIFCMLIPMLIGAMLQVFGLHSLSLPPEPLALALVVLGSAVGSRWGSLRSDRVWICLVAGFVLAAFLIGISAATAWFIAKVMNLDLLAVVLALAPGGISEISLMAVTLGIDPSFVGLHHMFRVAFIFLTVPLIVAYVRRTTAT